VDGNIEAPVLITFRPLQRDDFPMVREWLGRPHVAEWWGDGDSFDADYLPVVAGEDPTCAYIALESRTPIGFIQRYQAVAAHADGWWREEHDPGVWGIDQFLADGARLAQGLGTRMITQFLAVLFADPTVTRVQTDPSPHNARAIRCYEKCGFVPSSLIDTPDGPALLMHCERPA
jgi:RimJ/RimL family protein N-acetyltransferase